MRFCLNRSANSPLAASPRRPVAASPFLLLAAVSAIAILRLFLLIDHHAVNILYWDQWVFYTPLFENASLWTHFTWLHGPHRQGLGGLLLKVTAEWSGWNTRTEAFLIGALSCLALLAAVDLRRALFGRLQAWDVALPLIVLTLSQFQIYVGASNFAYGALPCLLLLLYCRTLLIERAWGWYALLPALNFLLTFTGWGVFVAPITTLLFALDLGERRRKGEPLGPALLGLAAAIATIALFLHHYQLNTAAQPLPGRTPRFWEYPLFVLLMYARFVRPETGPPGPLSALAFLFGTAVVLATLLALARHGRRIRRAGPRAERRSLVVCVLCGYGLLFAAATALGRTSMGLNVSQSSRYMSLLLLGFLGLYFHLLALESSRAKRIMLAVFLALLLPGHLPIRLGDTHPASYFSVNKRAWKQCYLTVENVESCDALPDLKTDFVIGIGDAAWKLDYLKRRRLNLYLNQAR